MKNAENLKEMLANANQSKATAEVTNVAIQEVATAREYMQKEDDALKEARAAEVVAKANAAKLLDAQRREKEFLFAVDESQKALNLQKASLSDIISVEKVANQQEVEISNLVKECKAIISDETAKIEPVREDIAKLNSVVEKIKELKRQAEEKLAEITSKIESLGETNLNVDRLLSDVIAKSEIHLVRGYLQEQEEAQREVESISIAIQAEEAKLKNAQQHENKYLNTISKQEQSVKEFELKLQKIKETHEVEHQKVAELKSSIANAEENLAAKKLELKSAQEDVKLFASLVEASNKIKSDEISKAQTSREKISFVDESQDVDQQDVEQKVSGTKKVFIEVVDNKSQSTPQSSSAQAADASVAQPVVKPISFSSQASSLQKEDLSIKSTEVAPKILPTNSKFTAGAAKYGL
jgi:hypothetical protein